MAQKEPGHYRNMIDNLSILLSHVLIALAFWHLTKRDDLDLEDPPAPDAEPEGFGYALRNRKKPTANGEASGDA